MLRTIGPLRLGGRRVSAEVVDDGLVLRVDRTGVASWENWGKVAVLVCLVAGIALFSTNRAVGWALVGLAVGSVALSYLVMGVALAVGAVSLTTRRGRAGARRGLRSLVQPNRTVAESLRMRPDHVAVVPRRPVDLRASDLVLPTSAGPQPLSALPFHRRAYDELRAVLGTW